MWGLHLLCVCLTNLLFWWLLWYFCCYPYLSFISSAWKISISHGGLDWWWVNDYWIFLLLLGEQYLFIYLSGRSLFVMRFKWSCLKGLVHPKMKILSVFTSPKNENSVSIYSPSCCSKPLCVYLFCWTQRKIFLLW